jgi:DNA-3-methyladenine glycosylase I
MDIIRCSWAESDDLMRQYHDEEWGVPLHDERKWFEFLSLDGAQAGLSWATILKRRSGYQQAFKNFEVAKVAAMTDTELEEQLDNPAIIRNRLKIWSVRRNAQAFMQAQHEFGSFDNYMWQWVNNQPMLRDYEGWRATSPLSDAISKDLKKRGFTFVGSTIVYAILQSAGIVNDHELRCWRRMEISK